VRDGGAGQPGRVRGERPRWQVGQGAVGQVGEHLLDLGMVTVVLFGLEGGERGVGEHGVVAPGAEQLALAGGGAAVEVFDPADDQPRGDRLPLLGGEGGVGDLGYSGVGDPAAQLVIPDRPGIFDGCPGRVRDGCDRGLAWGPSAR